MSIIEIIFNILKYGFQCASLLIFRDFITFLVIGIVFTILKNVVTSIVARKDFNEIKEYKNEKLSKEELKKIMTDVGALAMYTAVGTVLKSTDNIIVSAVLGTTMVGYLSNYALIKKSIQLILNQFYHSVTPSIGNMKAEGENERQYDIFRKYNFTVFWITCFACTSFITLFTPFVRDIWLDNRYVLPMSIVLALVLDFFMANMTSVMSSFRNANGLFIQGKWRPLIMAITNVVLSIILAKPWGMFGVLIATSISRAVTQLWYDPILIFKKVFNRNAKEYFVRYAIYLIITAISSGITYHISKLISILNVYLNFIVLILLCIAIPNLLNTIIWFKTEDFKGIKKAGNKLLKKIKK